MPVRGVNDSVSSENESSSETTPPFTWRYYNLAGAFISLNGIDLAFIDALRPFYGALPILLAIVVVARCGISLLFFDDSIELLLCLVIAAGTIRS